MSALRSVDFEWIKGVVLLGRVDFLLDDEDLMADRQCEIEFILVPDQDDFRERGWAGCLHFGLSARRLAGASWSFTPDFQ